LLNHICPGFQGDQTSFKKQQKIMPKLKHNFAHGKKWPEFKKTLPKVNHHPIGENSLNLITLLV
jgi:hypothetical protein